MSRRQGCPGVDPSPACRQQLACALGKSKGPPRLKTTTLPLPQSTSQARIEDGVSHYSHNVGEVNFRRRAPLQLASTLGFVLNKANGKFLGISEDERAALHECLTWLRQPGNNRLCFFGNELENFDVACRELMRKARSQFKTHCCFARKQTPCRGQDNHSGRLLENEDSRHYESFEKARRWDDFTNVGRRE